MKKILFVASITVIGLSAAFAQDVKQAEPVKATRTSSPARARVGENVSPEDAAQRRTDRLDKELSLNADQKKKVYDVFLKESKEKQGRLVQNQEVDDQLKSIFNEQQNQKYEAMKMERKQMMQQRIQSARSAELKSPTPVK
jgi:opacity protein-like surface antigen